MVDIGDTTVDPIDSLAGLHCPHCEYPLTGLPEHRCPECGNAFDPDELRAAIEGEPRPVQPWARREKIGFARAFAATWWEVMVHPQSFAAEFPVVPRSSDVRTFAWTCRLAAALIAAAAKVFLEPTTPFESVIVLLLLASTIAVASMVIEAILGASCAESQSPHPNRPALSRVGWMGLMNFGTAFLPVSASAFAIIHLAASQPSVAKAWTLSVLTALALWWWYRAGVFAAARLTSRKAWLTILFMAPAAVMCGLLISVGTAVGISVLFMFISV